MFRVIPVPGATRVPFSVAKRLQEGCSVVLTRNYVYHIVRNHVHLRFVEYQETVVVRFPRKHSDTSAALVVAHVIEE